MNNFYLITNNCQSVGFYNLLNIPYESPFIGHYIQDDLQYLKFCKNYEYYITQIPIFDKSIFPFYQLEDITRDTYPTMYLDDIEINWIHENNENECLSKYNRRLLRTKNKMPFFIWGDSLLHQYHTLEEYNNIVNEFMKIPNSLYITKDKHFYWQNCNFIDRRWDKAHSNPVVWLKPDLVNKCILDYFFTNKYISNKYISSLYNEYIKTIIFYINDNKIYVKTYILDENLINNKISYNISIYENLNNEKYESFYIDEDYKIFDTSIQIIPQIYTNDIQEIPKTIIQTDENNKYTNLSHYYVKQYLLNNNIDYEYKFFDNIARRNFIIENLKELPNNILKAYDNLIPGAFQSDIFRYIYLYIKGGCYLDNKIILLEKLNNILKNNEIHICMDYEKTNTLNKNYKCESYLNSIIFTKNKHPGFYELLENIKNNILNKNNYFLESINYLGDKYILELTGPTLFYKIFNKYLTINNYIFKHIVINDKINFNDFQIVDFNNKIIAYKTFNKNNNSNNDNFLNTHYSLLWFNKIIFYNYFKTFNIKNNILYIFYNFIDLNFKINNNFLIVESKNHSKNVIIKLILMQNNNTINIKIFIISKNTIINIFNNLN